MKSIGCSRWAKPYTILMLCLSHFAVPAAIAQLTAPANRHMDEHVAIVRLGRIGYIVDTNKSSKVYINKQAIIAFQKVHGLKRGGALTESIVEAIVQSVPPIALDSINRYHIEVDLKRQILFLVDSNNTVSKILSVSTGSGKRFFYPDKGWRYAITPKGRFHVYYKIRGWKVSKLGILLNPLYVVGGVAIHGAMDVPVKPASHGCIRIPLFAADQMYYTITIGTPVTIY